MFVSPADREGGSFDFHNNYFIDFLCLTWALLCIKAAANRKNVKGCKFKKKINKTVYLVCPHIPNQFMLRCQAINAPGVTGLKQFKACA